MLISQFHLWWFLIHKAQKINFLKREHYSQSKSDSPYSLRNSQSRKSHWRSKAAPINLSTIRRRIWYSTQTYTFQSACRRKQQLQQFLPTSLKGSWPFRVFRPNNQGRYALVPSFFEPTRKLPTFAISAIIAEAFLYPSFLLLLSPISLSLNAPPQVVFLPQVFPLATLPRIIILVHSHWTL